MDDESAEIELLEQNLNKTRQISQRMITILNSFDTRIAKLEKSIWPIYSSSQILNKRASNIEKTLLKIDEVASSQDGIAAEEALILRGPQTDQLDTYKDALERLNTSIAFKSSDRDTLDTARLVETGAKKLTQLYTKLVAEASSGSTPPPGADLSSAPFPANLLATLQPLVAFLRTLPLPSTHPSHPAAAGIMSTLKEAQRGYADMRGTWCRKCLETQGKRVLDRADTIDGVVAGKEFGRWVASLLSVADNEYTHLMDLTPLASSATLASSYNTLLTPLISLFTNTLTSLIALIKRSLHKHTFLALSAYAELLALQPKWDDSRIAIRRGASDSTGNVSFGGGGKKEGMNEMKEGLQAIRAVCLRSFPEFLADLKLAAMGKGGSGELGTGLADFVVLTVKYLDRLPEVQNAAGSALLLLGDGNWKMGEGVQVGKGPKLGEGDEKIILEHYVYDIVTTTISSLTALSRRRPGAPPALSSSTSSSASSLPTNPLSSIFLLNNTAQLLYQLLLTPTHPSLPSLLSPPAKEAVQSAWRMAKAGYFEANFGGMLGVLDEGSGGTGGKGGGGKTSVKERMVRFYDLLEEVVERHRAVGGVLRSGAAGRKSLSSYGGIDAGMEGGLNREREVLAEEVVKLVVPSLKRFVQKHREKEFSKNPQKYIKLSPEVVETQLRGMYS